MLKAIACSLASSLSECLGKVGGRFELAYF